MGWAKSFAPKGLQQWPQEATDLDPARVQQMYVSGFAGAVYDPEARAEMLAGCLNPNGEQVAYDNNFAGLGSGKLTLPYLYAYAHWPKCWPSPGQTTGSCVSKAGKNAAIVNIGTDVASAMADEVSGKLEAFPEISEEAERNGVVASEPIYGARGHSGQGANCGTLQKWMMTEGGILLRQNYPDAGVDLTKANDSIGARWGGRGTPDALEAAGKQHQFRQATDCPNHEVVRDFHAAGYSNWACSGLGWSSKRDENGYSKQQGGWSHSWITMAYDDRDVIKQKYGFPLALYLHDWGIWNTGGRRIFQSASYVPPHLKDSWIQFGLVDAASGDLLIPEGAFWMDARLLDRCDCTAMSSVNGWPAKTLPPFNTILG